MIITPLDTAVLPRHAGVSGETPWAVITIWVSTIVVPQIPAKISMIVMVNETENNHRIILQREMHLLIFYLLPDTQLPINTSMAVIRPESFISCVHQSHEYTYA